MTLTVVPPLPNRDNGEDYATSALPPPVSSIAHPDPRALPTFEGEAIELLRAKLASTGSLEVSDNPHRLDDSVRLLVTARVQRVDHILDDRTGKLTRVETLKIVDAVEVPWALAGALLLDDDELHHEIYGDGDDDE